MIWIPSTTEAWEAVQVVSNDANSVTVRRTNGGGSEFKVPGNLSAFATVSIQTLEENCDNLVDLEAYNEGIILHHIKKRFSQDRIYTFVGNILIAVNPYKTVDIYGLSVIERIYGLIKKREAPPPHVFSIAANAVFSLKQEAKNQSILISGESGAGKTEATKKILQFVSTVCSSTASRIGPSIENQILDTNPLLESFGNAKTIRNNNSSRFGKYMEVNFDKQYAIKGCNITAYLLEKSRVVKQGPNERNYHIFYMLLAGASKEMRKEFALKPAEEFRYLAQSGCVEIARRDELTEFEDLIFAMNNLGIDISTQHVLFQCLAAILHLGNLSFLSSHQDDGAEEGSRIEVPSDCRRIASLLTIDADRLQRVLCNKDTMINGEALLVPLPPSKAMDQRDSLAKYLYGKLFDFLLYRINLSLFRGRPHSSIGVLDIFGFEVFPLNSFEQLCINYCNERLQTFFNEIIFEAEMKTYSAEGLPVDDIVYQDNVGCVRLVDLRGAGIFAYLDEECAVPKGSDEKFVSKLNQIFDENASTKSLFFQRNHKTALSFTIRHFAGDVHYDARNFLEKNKDAMAESLLSLFSAASASCSLPVLTEDYTGMAVKLLQPANANDAAGNQKSKKGSKQTLSSKFKQDLDLLMQTLRATQPHFIRCIKPNADQQPHAFEGPLALNQLKYSGLFEAISIRKAGYEVRLTHEVFLQRYKHCLPTQQQQEMQQKDSRKDRTQFVAESVLALLDTHESTRERKLALDKPQDQKKKSQQQQPAESNTGVKKRWFCVGQTKIFLRSQTLKGLLDILRDACATRLVVQIQALARGFLCRQRTRHLFGGSALRKEAEQESRRREEAEMQEEDRLSRTLEHLLKSDNSLQRRLHEAKMKRIQEEKLRVAKIRLEACLLIQKIFRGYFHGRRGRVLLVERLFERSLEKREEGLMQLAMQRMLQWRVTSPLIAHYHQSVKHLILEVMKERYVENQIREAIDVKSLELLRSAITQAETYNMPYLPILSEARQVLAGIHNDRAVVSLLADELSRCTSIAILARRHDLLQFLVAEALRRGLHHEPKVSETANRLKKITNVIALRERLRSAVEICSPTRMKRAMEERQKLLRVFSDDFLLEEATAIENMRNMLCLQQTLLSSTSVDGSERKNMHEIYAMITGSGTVYHDIPAEDASFESTTQARRSSDGDGNGEDDVIYLPRFVRDPLVKMRHAQSHAELTAAMAEYVKLVPVDFDRKFYLRVFKWTVAFAFWLKPDPRLIEVCRAIGVSAPSSNEGIFEHEILPEQMDTRSPRRPALSITGGVSSGVRPREREKKSPAKTMLPRQTMQNNTVSPTKAVKVHIPFAQRQAKSEVAAREMLKKAEKLQFAYVEHQADKMIQHSLRDIHRFRSKIASKPTFSG